MSLEAKAAIVLAMMVAVGVLMFWARRRNYEAFRREHTMRKMRVPVEDHKDDPAA